MNNTIENKEVKTDSPHIETPSSNKVKLWLKRLGFAGFMFFLIKGLIWVAIFAGMGKCFFN